MTLTQKFQNLFIININKYQTFLNIKSKIIFINLMHWGEREGEGWREREHDYDFGGFLARCIFLIINQVHWKCIWFKLKYECHRNNFWYIDQLFCYSIDWNNFFAIRFIQLFLCPVYYMKRFFVWEKSYSFGTEFDVWPLMSPSNLQNILFYLTKWKISMMSKVKIRLDFKLRLCNRKII